jgi:hypothetical protein
MVQVAELSQTFAAHVAAQAAQIEELCVIPPPLSNDKPCQAREAATRLL